MAWQANWRFENILVFNFSLPTKKEIIIDDANLNNHMFDANCQEILTSH